MDSLDRDRELIEHLILEQTRIPYTYGDIQFEPVFDRQRDRYVLIISGREGPNNVKRVHGCLIHVDLINGKFWIQRDGTEAGIASQLVEAGIPKHRIVLASHSEERRKRGDYAVN